MTMASFVQVNFFTTTISAAITSSSLSISLGSTTGAPTIPSGSYWPLILTANSVYEVVYVSALSGSTATVLRGQEGTTAQSWASGTTIFGAFTAGAVLYDGDSMTADNLTVTGTTTLQSNVTVDAPASGVATTINGLLGQKSLEINSGSSATDVVADLYIQRNGSTANTFGAGPGVDLQDIATNGGATTIQQSGGQTEIWQYNGGWNQLAFWGTTRGLTLNAPASGNALTVNGLVQINSPGTWQTGASAITYFGDTNSYINNTFGSPLVVRGFNGVEIGTPQSGTALTVNGTVYASDFNSPSDANLKTDIRPINGAKERVKKIRGVFFKWISNNKESAGVIAQEVRDVFPEAVRERPDGTLSVDPMALIGLLFAAAD